MRLRAVAGQPEFLAARKFYIIVLGIVLSVFAVIAFTPISSYLFTVVMGNTPQVARQAAVCLRFFVLLPAVFIVRDVYGSVAIRLKQTYILFIGTVSRVLLAVIIILIIANIHVSWDYLIPGIFFLLTGVAEAATVFIGIKIRIPGYLLKLDQMPCAGIDRKKLSFADITTFAVPVFVMALIQSLGGTFINGGLARTVSPELAIAAFAVAWTVVQSIDSASAMFHQVVLNFMKDDYSNRSGIQGFGMCIAVVLVALIAAIGFTPLGYWLMNTVIGTSPLLSQMGVAVIRICILLPVLGVIRQYYWGIAIKEHKTLWLTIGSAIQVGTLILIIIVLTLFGAFPSNPAIIGAAGVIGSIVFECLYLWAQTRAGVQVDYL